MESNSNSGNGTSWQTHLRRLNRPLFWSLLLFAMAICLGGWLKWYSQPLPFTPEAWKEQPHLRSRMVEDLLARNLLQDASSRQVNELLGVPRGRDTAEGDRYIYWIGTAGIDDNWLEIEFQQDQAVEIRSYPD